MSRHVSTVIAALVATCVAVGSVPAAAQSTAPAELGTGLGQLLFALLVVVGLIFASLWLLKRLSAPRGGNNGLLRVIAATAVGARERVVVLEVDGRWLVLGIAPGRVTSLAELPRGETPAGSAPPVGEFVDRLKQILERKHAP